MDGVLREVHMERMTIPMLAMLLLTLAPAALPGQDNDISGTWVGDAALPGSSEKDRITLVIEKTGESYAGKFSDSLGLGQDVALENLTYNDGRLRFTVLVKIDGRETRLRAGLNLSSGRLIGGWGGESGAYGAVELSRKKQDDG
jgi:hypothetical protein